MDAARYRIVLKGEIMAGYDPATAIQTLARLFGQPPERLRNIFNGKTIPLSQELDLRRAQLIQARLHAVGIQCNLQPVGEAAGPPAAAPAAPVIPNSSVLALQIDCPQCGHHQAPTAVCGKCGLDFAKLEAEEVAVALAQERSARSADRRRLWRPAAVVVIVAAVAAGILLRKQVDTDNFYAHAAENVKAQVPDTPQGLRTAMVLRGTALVIDEWSKGERDMATLSLERLMTELQLPAEQFLDGWGNAVRVAPTAESFIIASAGPDGTFDTPDDIRFTPPLRR